MQIKPAVGREADQIMTVAFAVAQQEVLACRRTVVVFASAGGFGRPHRRVFAVRVTDAVCIEPVEELLPSEVVRSG